MPTTLLLDLADAAPAPWRMAAAQADPRLAAGRASRNLVQCGEIEAPEGVICLAAGLTAEVEQALAAWNGAPPCPVLLLTPAPAAGDDEMARALAVGIHEWSALDADALSPAAFAHALAQARARWRHEGRLREALARAQAQLEERKWVERAKGVLMSGRGMDEDAAFRLLRGAAMNVNLRVGELSRAVFEAAQWADAMNRAGQLRMLSQRCVRLVAQRVLRIDARAAASLAAASAQRVRENLALLAQQCAGTGAEAACAEAARCWQALAELLDAPRADAALLPEVDRRAEALLAAAERLTEALQAAAGRRALHIVNQCGRQRLRVQRIAKDSLLAALQQPAAAPSASARDAALDEFEQVLRDLEQAPLSSAEIRATLAQVRDEWLRLLAGLRSAGRSDGRRTVVHASENLLERLDALTAAYEHSLQVIMS
jgi:AmiR/NasT family two-component response regulator